MIPLLLAVAVAMPVEAHRGHDRLLVVFAADAASAPLAAQRRALHPAAAPERALAVGEVIGDRVRCVAASRRVSRSRSSPA